MTKKKKIIIIENKLNYYFLFVCTLSFAYLCKISTVFNITQISGDLKKNVLDNCSSIKAAQTIDLTKSVFEVIKPFYALFFKCIY